MRTWLGLAVVAALALPATSAAKSGCPVRDARDTLAAAGQGINGRVTSLIRARGHRSGSQPSVWMASALGSPCASSGT